MLVTTIVFTYSFWMYISQARAFWKGIKDFIEKTQKIPKNKDQTNILIMYLRTICKLSRKFKTK